MGNLLKPLRLGSKILVVSNRKVASLFLKPVQRSLAQAGYEIVPPHLLRYGDERDKSTASLFSLWQHMAKVGLERTSTVVALGGGVVGDLAGFAASTYMRGIPLVQVPTTLLAQVDAAIGGKTAIDLPEAKNIVGTFYEPRMVVMDVTALARLNEFSTREVRNGFAEVIKYAVIQDRTLFDLLEKNLRHFRESISKKKSLGARELSFLENVIYRSARVKAKIVEEDERETKGKRLILNYGHTFAHAFEAASQYRMPHGEAVALGMVSAARLAHKRGLLARSEELRQSRLLQATGLPVTLGHSRFPFERLIRHMRLDKKKKYGKLRFVLPERIGKVRIVEDISLSEIRPILKELKGVRR